MTYTQQQLEELETYCDEEKILYDAFRAYLENIHDPDEWAEHKTYFEDSYVGEYSDGAEFAYEIVDDLYNINDDLRHYFDYDAYWRDLLYGGEYWISDDGHIFRG